MQAGDTYTESKGYTFFGRPAKEQCGMAEQWRDIEGYDGIYQVSDQGQVRNTHTSKILQPVKIKTGGSTSAYQAMDSNGNAPSTAWSPLRF